MPYVCNVSLKSSSLAVNKYQLFCDRIPEELDPEMSLHDYDIDQDGVRTSSDNNIMCGIEG
jgi:hypothetical protein